MISQNLTFFIFESNQGKDLKRQTKNLDIIINIIISHEMILWQGIELTKLTQEKLSYERIEVFADCKNKAGLVLSLIRAGFKNIIFHNYDKKLEKKIKQIADNNKSKIYKKDSFFNIFNSRKNYDLKKIIKEIGNDQKH